MIKLAVALLFLAANFYTYHYLATDEVIPERRAFAEYPTRLGDWSCAKKEKMDPEIHENLGASDYILCNYQRGPDAVHMYVGYHETQVRKEGGGASENSIHPPEHCLPGSGWDIIEASVVPIDFAGLPEGALAKRFVIAKQEYRQLVYFWYQSRGRVMARSTDVIVNRFLDRAVKGRTDGSLVRFITSINRGDVEAAEARFRDLANQAVPAFAGYLPN